MSIRVGKTYGNKTEPSYPGFTPIWVTTKGKGNINRDFNQLSPYYLNANTDEALKWMVPDNSNMENIWQYSKIYPKVTNTMVHAYGVGNIIVKPGKHIKGYKNDIPIINSDYHLWREFGMRIPQAVRYPVGYHDRHNCCGAYWMGEVFTGYIEARKRIYVPVYITIVKRNPRFVELKRRFKNGENIMIIDVDGPDKSVEYPFKIDGDSVLATKETLNYLLNDPRKPFGHGFCLASALMDIELDIA